jgi:hypothetical protein
MIFGLSTESRNDPEYVRNIAFWVRRLFDLTQFRVETLTTTQEVKITRTLYLVDTTSGSVTVTLPTAKEAKGEWIVFKKIASAHSMIIDGNGSETIDGTTSHTINGKYDTHEIVSDGTAWYIVN